MMRLSLRRMASVPLLVAALLVTIPVVGHAQYANTNITVLNINFDGDAYGSEPATSYPGAMGPPWPATIPQAVGSFVNLFGILGTPDVIFGPTNGLTHTVHDVAGMTKALVLSNTAPASATDTSVNFVDHNFSVPAVSRSVFEVDFAQLETPSGTNAGFRSDFLVVAFKQNSNPFQRAWTIGTRHGFPGQIYLQREGGVTIPIGTYTNGVVTHIRVETFYEGGGRYHVYLNGQLAAENQPFHNPMFDDADQIKELFLQQPGATDPNVWAIDNLVYTVMIPEPSTMLLGALAFGALVLRRHRRS